MLAFCACVCETERGGLGGEHLTFFSFHIGLIWPRVTYLGNHLRGHHKYISSLANKPGSNAKLLFFFTPMDVVGGPLAIPPWQRPGGGNTWQDHGHKTCAWIRSQARLDCLENRVIWKGQMVMIFIIPIADLLVCSIPVLSGTIPYLGFQSIISLYKRALVPGCLGGCLDTYVISSILRQEQHWLGERPLVSSKVFQILDAEERYLKSGGRSTYVQ